MRNFVNSLRWGLLCTAYFPILSILAFAVLFILSIPYVCLGSMWLIFLPLLLITLITDIFPFLVFVTYLGQMFLALILIPFIALTFCTIYTVFYGIFIFTFPFWLLLGLIDSELVIPDDFPASRWVVLFTYLVMPILPIAAIYGSDIQSVISGLGRV